MSEPSRYGFVVNIKPEKREEYLELHRSVWPRVEEAMSENGIRNYSILVIENTLFGYFEYVGDNYEADMAKIKVDVTSQEWWRLTDPCQIAFGTGAPGELWREMDLAWHMD